MTRIIKIVLKSLAVLIVGLAVVLTLWTGFDAFSFKRVKARAFSVHPGDTMQSVISTLGEPRHTFPKGSGLFLKSEHKTLAYGSVFDWKNFLSKEPPFFFPFRWRRFGPSNDDIVVVLDDSGKALEVKMPKDN